MRKYFNFLFLLICILGICSCKFEIENITRDKVLDYITVDVSGANQLSYVIGDTFISKGIKVYGHYSDNSVELIDNKYVNFEGFDSSETNESLEITANYAGKEGSFSVSVGEIKVESIKIIQRPSKLYFTNSEVKNGVDSSLFNDMIVYAYYTKRTDGSQKIEKLNEDEYTIEVKKFNDDSFNEFSYATVFVYYAEKKELFDSFNIVKSTGEIEKIIIKNQPNRKVYLEGKEDLDVTGIKIGLKFKGQPDYINWDDRLCSFQPVNISQLSATTSHTIYVKVNDKTTLFDIQIIKSAIDGAELNPDYEDDFKSLFYEKLEYDLEDKFVQKFSTGEIGSSINSNSINRENDDSEKTSNHLRYSYNEDVGFDNAKELSVPLIPYGTGSKTLFLYYRYYDELTKNYAIYNFTQQISVADSKLERIEAVWSGIGYPLGVKPDCSNSEYGTWSITGYYNKTSKSYITIPAEYCEYSYDSPLDDIRNLLTNVSSCKVPVKVTYFDSRINKSIETTADVTVRKPALLNVEITSYPRINYYEGETLDFSEFDAVGTFSDGSKQNYDEDSVNDIVECRINSEDISAKISEYTLTKACNSLKLTFKNDINDYSKTIKINVDEVVLTDLNIIPKGSANLTFRENTEYKSDYLANLFDVKPVYNCSAMNKIKNLILENLTFELVKKNNKFVVSVSYKDEKNRFIYAEYDEFTMLGALPEHINVDLSKVKRFDTYADLIANANTKYIVNFKGGKEEELKWDSGKKEYIDSYGRGYSIESNKTGLTITLCDDSKAVEETEITTKHNIKIIKKISMKIKDAYKNQGFAYKHDYDYSKYFDFIPVYADGSEGNKEIIDSSTVRFVEGKFDSSNITENGSSCELYAMYVCDNGFACNESIEIKMYPPFIREITAEYSGVDGQEVTIQEGKSNIAAYCCFNVTYEDGKKDLISLTNINDKKNIYNFSINDFNFNSLNGSINLTTEYKCNAVKDNLDKDIGPVGINVQFDCLGIDYKDAYKNKEKVFLYDRSSKELGSVFDVYRKYKITKYSDSNECCTCIKEESNNVTLSLSYNNGSNRFKKSEGKICATDNVLKDTQGNSVATVLEGIYIVPHVSKIIDSGTYYYESDDIEAGKSIDDVIFNYIKDQEAYSVSLIVGNDSAVVGKSDFEKYGISLTEDKKLPQVNNKDIIGVKDNVTLTHEYIKYEIGDLFNNCTVNTLVNKPGSSNLCYHDLFVDVLINNKPLNEVVEVKISGNRVKSAITKFNGYEFNIYDHLYIKYENNRCQYQIKYKKDSNIVSNHVYPDSNDNFTPKVIKTLNEIPKDSNEIRVIDDWVNFSDFIKYCKNNKITG